MKTDRFSDIIRRKLESIRPEFTENDWARMQSSLQQAGMTQSGPSATGNPFSGGTWVGRPWLTAAAAVSTAVLVAYSVWQRREINQLRHTISEYHQQAHSSVSGKADSNTSTSRPLSPGNGSVSSGMQQTESGNLAQQNTHASNRIDTVYITRYVAVPTAPRTELPAHERANQSLDATNERVATNTTNLSNRTQTGSYGVSSTPVTSSNSTYSPSATPGTAIAEGSNSQGQTASPSKRYNAQKGQYDQQNLPQQTEGIASGNRSTTRTNADNTTSSETGVINNNTPGQVNAPAGPAEAKADMNNYELVASLPLNTESFNWNSPLATRARRIRPARAAVPTTAVAQAPTSQPVEPTSPRIRVGTGSEVSAHLWSAGAFAELIVGRHWTLGVGLSRATYLGGAFITAYDFDVRTNRDFKQTIGRGLPPNTNVDDDVYNIDTRIIRLQAPITLGYRIRLNRSLTFTPTVGTYLNFSSTEKATFYYRSSVRAFDQVSYSGSCPVDLLSSFTLSTGIEWQRGHWVLQGIPVVTIPQAASDQPGPKWETNTTVGLRARLLYQF